MERVATLYAAVIEFPKMRVGIRVEGEVVTGIQVPSLRDAPARAGERARRAHGAPDRALSRRSGRVVRSPVVREGTQFQNDVWRQISEIPRGRTLTYGELARRIGGRSRAPWARPAATTLPIVIPCHRVVAADGIGGFSHHVDGYLMEAKTWLLMHEATCDGRERGCGPRRAEPPMLPGWSTRSATRCGSKTACRRTRSPPIAAT